ncbi:sucrase ferredoxin [Nocardioides psychrotolerans]|uniref:Sucrase/ferredoxin-like n=1 Tax=Nocardioides psychrotolerans TaxID=1005945 RepID=A0A1I3PMH9_9ACTN|nr:sucrase ferredoxin [Nocardioides psychrotolerans]GEP39711.1 sucrase ferredoxin [Nocardioides psychrotolerans]SFJ22712.1 hypothetical protein SAMN05216561_12138 [Nocardioides psychrotolerans]
MDIRCAALSLADAEPLAGTAPTEADWLLVEHSGSWGRKAVAESNLPDEVREHLLGLAGVRVQLIRRHGRETDPTSQVRVFTVSLAQSSGQRAVVRSAVLADVGELLTMDLVADAGDPSALTPYDEPLWLVCTNGRRDVCCAELGRPVAAALAARWPDATWETTHLGGHRFSGTLLALPSGLALGRLDAASAVKACEEVEAGLVPALLTRGRAGRSGAEQVAELHLRGELAFADVETLRRDGDTILLSADGEQWQVVVAETRGEPRRQSCADDERKAAPVYVVRSAGRASAPSS